jgi:Tol biopolymer transport system component
MRRSATLVLVLGAALSWSKPEAAIYSEWSAPTNLGATVNSTTTDIAPAISKNQLSLYFSSTRSGGSGAFDIWVSHRSTREDAWGTPMNLGSNINTAANDQGATLSDDGHMLFFVSDRDGGYGGQDIWVSWRAHINDDFGWQPPVNLGGGVNTSFNDHGPGYFNDEESGVPLLYFGSDRPGGLGLDDIYVSALMRRGNFGAATVVEELSTPEADVGPDVRRDGREILFHSNRPGTLGLFDLWISTRKSNHERWSTATRVASGSRGRALPEWSLPANMGERVNSPSAEGQPTMSADRKTLYFFSNRPGGLGGADLWFSTRTRARTHHRDHHR